jgi:hypothetical protein
MQHVARRDGETFEASAHGNDSIARVLGMEPIGAASTQWIEFDALKQPTAICKIAAAGAVKQGGFNDLHLERNGQTIAQTSRAAADQDFASLDHFPHHQGLQPEDVELSIGVGGG